MNKTELIEQIKPKDRVYFEFTGVTSVSSYKTGWYEYVNLSKCDSPGCSCKRDGTCPGKTKFEGLSSQCLVWNNKTPVTNIRKTQYLPEHLFEIEI